MEDLRRLIYVPILHAQEDAKHKASILPKDQKIAVKKVKIARELSAVDEMWEGIAAKIEGLNLHWNKTRIYQDGTPVCGNELRLAKRLAESGSPNFSFILDLIKKGATLEGTEDMDLLIQEYDLLNKLLMKSSATHQQSKNAEYQTKSRELLALRDQFILNRITGTLKKKNCP
ncbi:MAG: hypothetical protein WCP96_07410 [Methylococcaceae bacterium]